MTIALHLMEPWLIEYQHARYNLGESGVTNMTVAELLACCGASLDALGPLSLANGDTTGARALRELIAGFYPGVTPEQILVTTGTSEAIFLYFAVRRRPGDNVVVPFPAFQTLYEVPRYLGYEVRLARLRRERQFRPDLDELVGLIDDHTRVVVLNNPHNPTGIVWTPDEIRIVRAAAARHGAEVLADEHYRFLPYSDESELLPSLCDGAPGTAGVGSMIKCFGCVGLRIGWLIGDAALLAACRDFKDYTTHTVCSITEHLAAVALRGWRDIVPRYRHWVRDNAAQLGAFVAHHGDVFGWVPAQAGAVAFPWLRDGSIEAARFSRALVDQTEVFLLPGETFEIPGHLRLGLGVSPADFAEALRRLGAFVERRGWT
jgi:aspartate/methionine/tyrosine aminotransferase